MERSPDEVWAVPALELARRVRARTVSSEELTRYFLGRIARHNPRLSAFVTVLEARALRHARAMDRAVAAGEPLAPFHGVPTAIKDLNLVRGTPTRMGSRAFRHFWSPIDDRVAAQLRRGGFVFLGKLATSELGAMPVTEPDIHPPTRNPWNLDHSSGGSSGGSSAAVAAGLLPLAQGSDGAGSIRIPASFCGLYGIKPSRGRVQNAFGFPDQEILYTDGPLARTVDDAAAMLDVLAGVTVGRPHWAPPPPRPFAELARESPKGLRVRLVLENPVASVDPEAAAAARKIAQALERLGHAVEEWRPVEASFEEFLPVWQHLVASTPWVRWSKVQPITRWLGEAGRRVDAREIRAVKQRLVARALDWFEGADLVVSPTTPTPAPRVGSFRHADPAEAFRAAAPLGAFTAAFNLTGQPAASVPAGLSASGLPLGVQLVGRPLADATVLAVSRQLEEALPWRTLAAPLARDG